MKVLTSSLHLEYVDPDQMFYEQNAKKSRVQGLFKKNYGHSSRHTQNEKVGKWFIDYYLLCDSQDEEK